MAYYLRTRSSTPLIDAIRNNRHDEKNIDDIKKLIKNNAAGYVNIQDNLGNTALIYASYIGYIEVVNLLLTMGADPNIQNKHGYTALMDASSRAYIGISKLLLEYGADPDIQSYDSGYTVLRLESWYDTYEIVKLLLKYNVNVNFQNKYGETALMYAMLGSRIRIINLLLKCGADVKIKTKHGVTALMGLSDINKSEVDELLQYYADENNTELYKIN